MTVAERRGGMERIAGSNNDQFPVGMRVLAVDDDPTCLKLLESLLLRCQYHVTTTNQAIVALKMLRENRDRFDLVISDVHMPDMDGFKLLEIVGLEMDLPVIMLSGNGETQAVMKGISHGACDYLLKPVRIEELKNIWQHVVRRRKLEARDHNNSDDGEDDERAQAANSEAGQDLASAMSDRNQRLNRKRKDQNEDGEDGSDDSAHEDEDPSSQKKQRVVWSIELHRKFVAAVNHLGIDRAVPKKILDLMNVEKLSRENVASHLQKYRIFLKKANDMASRQANLVAALRGRNPGYLPVGSLEGLRNFHPLAASRQLPAFTSFQINGLIGTMNKPIGFGQQAIRPSITVQQGDNYNIENNHATDLSRLEGTGLMENSHGNLLHGMPVPLELVRPQQHQALQQANNRFPAGLSTTGLAIGHSRKPLANVTNSTTLITANQQHTASGVLGNVLSAKVTPLNSDPFKMSRGNSFYLPDPGRCSESWQAAVPSANYSANASSAATPLAQNITPSSNSISSVTQTTTHMDRYVHGVSSINLAMEPLSQTVLGDDVQHQTCMFDGNGVFLHSGVDENLGFLNNIEPRWESREEILRHSPSLISACPLTLPSHVTSSIPENQGLNSGSLHEKMNRAMISQNYGAPFVTQDCKAENQQNREYELDSGKLHDGLSSRGCSLDDLVNGANKLMGSSFASMSPVPQTV